MNNTRSVLEWVQMVNKEMYEIKNFYYEHIDRLKTESLSEEMVALIERDKRRMMKLEKRWERLLHQKTTKLSFKEVDLIRWELSCLYNKLAAFSISQNNNSICIFN